MWLTWKRKKNAYEMHTVGIGLLEFIRKSSSCQSKKTAVQNANEKNITIAFGIASSFETIRKGSSVK